MAKIEQFEDVEAWQLARQLANRVYELTDREPFGHDFALRDQIRRAAISVMSNIAEGFESQNDKTFVRYLYIAKASAGEVRAQLYLARDRAYIDADEFSACYELATRASQTISGFIRYLSNRVES